MHQKIIDIYVFLQSKVNPKFRFPGGKSKSWVDRCVVDLTEREGSLALPIVIDYCIQQVFVYKDVSNGSRFSVSWAFSKKAVDKFYTAKRGMRYYQDVWLKGLGLNRDSLLSMFMDINEHMYEKEIYLEWEDATKSISPGTIAQYSICLTQTSLYTPKSPVCDKCTFKDKCRLVLKRSNPELLILREKQLKT